MCGVLEEMRNEVARKVARETEHSKAVQIARRMIKSGKLSYEEIAEMAGLPIDEVKALEERVLA